MKSMVELHNKYKDKGFTVLAFPSNDFLFQEPKSEKEIKQWATSKYNVEFPLFSKIHVKGKDMHPVYVYLLNQFPGKIPWNFGAKFIIKPDGTVAQRIGSGNSVWKEVDQAVADVLAAGDQ
eukprot:TRINITY_DN112258_c0_g1_i1.p2 TRINITY_DN112258_c0_g1~~TRINITY_DN112258_c0_g1_i1.p2  ORF type:complete len:121 (-),score=20.94 TRINITY_DN112258_c0_g1_i1:281-643(-)